MKYANQACYYNYGKYFLCYTCMWAMRQVKSDYSDETECQADGKIFLKVVFTEMYSMLVRLQYPLAKTSSTCFYWPAH